MDLMKLSNVLTLIIKIFTNCMTFELLNEKLFFLLFEIVLLTHFFITRQEKFSNQLVNRI